MGKNFLKNSIVSTLIFSFAFLPYLLPLRIYAQDGSGGSTQNGGSTEQGAYDTSGFAKGVMGYIEDAAPGITQLPLCKAKLGSALKNLFKGKTPETGNNANNSLLTNTIEDDYDPELDGSPAGLRGFVQDKYKSSQSDEVEEGIALDESVIVSDPEVKLGVDAIRASTDQTLTKVTSLEENDTCLKSIGRMIISMLIQKITVSTVAWIQSGFDGNPSFLEHPGRFFQDIARTNILQFGIEINDPVLFPYGKEFILAQADAFNRSFADNAQYSLDRLIKEKTPEFSADQFRGDFASGGWNAWINMTQNPANNAMGFYLLAEQELASRINGETAQREEELLQADGYLGDRRCADPEGITMEEHRAALEANVKVYEDAEADDTAGETPGSGETTGGYSDDGGYNTFPYRDSKGAYYIAGTCNEWEFVTPGQMIADSATTAINFPTNSLLKADDLNAAAAALINALLGQFTSQFMQKGFAGLPNEGSDGRLIINEDALDDNYIDTQVFSDYGGTNITPWLRKHHSFNIRTDLTQAFIDVQRTYIDKLKAYNNELELLKKYAYQLDYCIPGPTPDWKERAYATLDDFETQVPSEAGGIVEVVKGLIALLKGITLHVHPIGIGASINVGQVAEGIMSIMGEGLPEEIMTRYFYTSWLRISTGLRTAPTYQIESKGALVNIVDHVIRGYDSAIKKTYAQAKMPDVTSLSAAEYRKVKGYDRIIQNNLAEMAVMRSVVARLQVLKTEIDALDPGSNNYESNFDLGSAYNARFARISDNLVDGDDVAVTDKLWKSAIDNRKYIWENVDGGRGLIQECMDDLDETLETTTDRIQYPKNIFVLMEDVPYPGNELPEETLAGCFPPNVAFKADADAPGAPPTPQQLCSYDPEDPNSTPCYTIPLCGSMSPGGQICVMYDPVEPGGIYGPSGLYCMDIDDVVILNPDNTLPENPINISCPDDQVYDPSLPPDDPDTAENESCNEPDQIGDLVALGEDIDGSIEFSGTEENIPLDEESTFNTEVDEQVESYYAQVCGDTTTAIGESVATNNPYYAFGQNVSGFLQHGYYEEGLLNGDPRIIPPDAISEQRVRIPRGILDVDAKCPILKFGPSAKQGAKRSLKAEIKGCKKTYNQGDERNACILEASESAHKLMINACVTDMQVKNICDYKDPTTLENYTDTVRPFEKSFKLY